MAKTAVQARYAISKGRQGGSKRSKGKGSRLLDAAIKKDLSRVQTSICNIASLGSSATTGHGDEITVAVMLADEDTVQTLKVRESAIVREALFARLHIPPGQQGVEVLQAGEPLCPDASFGENGIHEGAMLTVRWPQAWSFFQILDELIDANPSLRNRREELIAKAGFDESNPEMIMQWDLRYLDIVRLPPSFGHLRVSGHLHLGGNRLAQLPPSFRFLSVGGDLDLSWNHLTTLPEDFGSLHCGGSLLLTHNRLRLLPDTIGKLRVSDRLSLSHNELRSLPESFGDIFVTGYGLVEIWDNPIARDGTLPYFPALSVVTEPPPGQYDC